MRIAASASYAAKMAMRDTKGRDQIERSFYSRPPRYGLLRVAIERENTMFKVQTFTQFFPACHIDEFIEFDINHPNEQLLLSEVNMEAAEQGWTEEQRQEQYDALWDEIKEVCEEYEYTALLHRLGD